MKIKHLVFLIFVYSVGGSFNFKGFVSDAKSDGINFQVESDTDCPHGFLVLAGGNLHVGLYESDKAAVPASGKTSGRPGTTKLAGDLNDYKALIDAEVENNKAPAK